MLLEELKQFMDDCIKKEIPFPKNTMTVVLEDFYDVVPKEHHSTKDLEYNHYIGNELARVQIIPKP